MTLPPRRVVRFGVFAVDSRAGELHKQDVKVRLQEQPFKILELLLAHRGEVVTREHLREKLWPADTFVDFDHGLNKSIQKLREALGDSADNPRFIETLPRRGYRFIAPVSEIASTSEPTGELPTPPRASGLGGRVVIGLATLSALVLIGFLAREGLRRAEEQRDGKIRMVVLPFENLSGDAQQEYFSDGLTEEMIAQLGRLQPQKLGVIARTSAWQYKETEKNIEQIGRELGVEYVLEGSVRKGPDRVRITAQLIQVSDQTHLWAKSYDRQLKDILIVQSEVAQAIAGEIQLRLRPQDKEKLARVGSVDPEAYQAYLLGRYYVSKFTEVGLTTGLRYLNQAIAREPNYALAYDGLSNYYLLASEWILPPKEAMPRAKAAAKRALEIDDSLAEGHASLGIVHLWYDWDWPAAEREFRRAIELNSGSARAHEFYGWYLAAMGRFEEAINEEKRALELDPLSAEINTLLGHILYFARREEEAIEQLQKALALDPNYWFAHLILGLVYQHKGDLRQSIALFQEARRLASSLEPVGALGQALALSGRTDEALKILNELKEIEKRTYVPAYQSAKIYASLGQRDQAFASLDRAYEERSLFLTWLKVEPELDALRPDPRFQDLLRRVGFPP